MQQPYNRTELRALQATLNARWPRLPPEEAERWLPRFKERRSPYSGRVHAIRLQLDAIVALALHQGFRRGELFRASIHDIHNDNLGAIARDSTGLSDKARQVPWTSRAQYLVAQWLDCREYLAGEHTRPWLNLHAGPSAHLPMTVHTFNRVLTTYLGPWSFARLRATSAVAWAHCGLPLERLRELLGLARIEDVLPYAQLAVSGSLERDIDRLNGPFIRLVQQVPDSACK